jgi:hypothetical protein
MQTEFFGDDSMAIMVFGELGDRSVQLQARSNSSFTIFYNERAPIGIVSTETLGWDTVKAIYR